MNKVTKFRWWQWDVPVTLMRSCVQRVLPRTAWGSGEFQACVHLEPTTTGHYRMTVGKAYCRHNTPHLNRFHNSKLNEHGTVCQLRKCTMQCCHCTSISSTPIPRILLGRNSTQNVTLHRETRKVNCRHSGVCSDANLNNNTLQHT